MSVPGAHKSEEGIKSTGTGIADGFETLWVLGNRPRSSAATAGAFGLGRLSSAHSELFGSFLRLL